MPRQQRLISSLSWLTCLEMFKKKLTLVFSCFAWSSSRNLVHGCMLSSSTKYRGTEELQELSKWYFKKI